jgi:antirestriction protein ArdC
MGRKYNKKSVETKKAEVKGLLDKLEEGVENLRTSEGWAQWLKFQSSLYSYSWNNCILIAAQCPNASVVMSFKAWKDNGRHVSLGQKGLKILAPCFRKRENKETGEKESVLAFFRTVSVFDLSQTEGEDLPSPCEKLVGGDSGLFESLKTLSEARSTPVRLEAIPGSVNGYYDCIGKFIAIEESNAPAQQAKTLAHEIAHSILHSDKSKAEQTRGDRELEAESVAFIVCNHFGLDTSDYSFGYVANWKGEDAKAVLKKSAKRIADAAKAIIEGLETQGVALEEAA